MNKRQTKKWKNKVLSFSKLDDVYCRCFKCQFYESEDMSVGLASGCLSDFAYDENGDIDESKDFIISEYMTACGYTCPYFSLLKGKRKFPKCNLPKGYREYKNRLKEIVTFEKRCL